MRPATRADLPALAALVARFETHWFGSVETDEAELDESFAKATASAVVDGGAAWLFAGTEVHLTVDPAHPEAYDSLLPWLREVQAPHVEVLSRDAAGLAAVARHGWERDHSSYELLGPVDALPEPVWPDGVTVTAWTGEDEPVHDLVYRRSGWTDVPGHRDRPLEQWRSLLLGDGFADDQQVLAWDGADLVGVALGRTWSDGTGWVSQLAVAQDHQGRGLGRALLLAALHRRVEAGATQLGLGVSARNPGALALYESVGLAVEREWVRSSPAG